METFIASNRFPNEHKRCFEELVAGKVTAQQWVQWIGGYGTRFQAFFVALGFFPFRRQVLSLPPATNAKC